MSTADTSAGADTPASSGAGRNRDTKDREKRDWRKDSKRRGTARRGGRKRKASDEGSRSGGGAATGELPFGEGILEEGAAKARPRRKTSTREKRERERQEASGREGGEGSRGEDKRDEEGREGRAPSRRRRRGKPQREGQEEGGATRRPQGARRASGENREHGSKYAKGPKGGGGPKHKGGKFAKGGKAAPKELTEVTGILSTERKGFLGVLRTEDRGWLDDKNDPVLPQGMMQKLKLREGSLIRAKVGSGYGKAKRQVVEIESVDGVEPREAAKQPQFKALTSIDPDFHYALGDETDEVSMRIVDLLCPVGRGTRGLIVAPPRSGKTILLQQFANGIAKVYPEVHLMVLLVDERPEEATEWQRSTNAQVFVSTNDEPQERHVKLAETVWARCRRLVEMGEDVILLLDSITRMARAYNNTIGAGSGRTMSGGLDSKAMERPKQFFGSARNTETAGSLTILGTTLIETGSRMDQVIFEEFKGTGNMELVLSRKLADRRIFPAIDIERSGTRKEEKLISRPRLRRINTLRRVLHGLHFTEAMELLITKLDDVEKNDDFLARFDVDPEA